MSGDSRAGQCLCFPGGHELALRAGLDSDRTRCCWIAARVPDRPRAKFTFASLTSYHVAASHRGDKHMSAVAERTHALRRRRLPLELVLSDQCPPTRISELMSGILTIAFNPITVKR